MTQKSTPSPTRRRGATSTAHLGALALLATLAGCDGGVFVQGRVVDTAGEPVAGAEINLGRPGESVQFDEATDAEGCFQIGGMDSPGVHDYDLRVAADGYAPYAESISNAQERAVLVTLSAAGSGRASSAERLASMDPAELEVCRE